MFRKRDFVVCICRVQKMQYILFFAFVVFTTCAIQSVELARWKKVWDTNDSIHPQEVIIFFDYQNVTESTSFWETVVTNTW